MKGGWLANSWVQKYFWAIWHKIGSKATPCNDWCDTILLKMLLKLLVLFHVDELYADFLPSFLDEVVTRW